MSPLEQLWELPANKSCSITLWLVSSVCEIACSYNCRFAFAQDKENAGVKQVADPNIPPGRQRSTGGAGQPQSLSDELGG